MFRTIPTSALALALLCVQTQQGEAAKVKTWHHHKPADHENAKFQRAVVSNAGTLQLQRQLNPLASLGATHVWALVEDKGGNLYAGTGDEGKVYKVSPDGKATIAYASEQSQVLSLAAAADGSVYAGTGPVAQVVQIGPTGRTKVLANLEESYVWSLAIDPKTQAVYAATGPKGKIYRVAPDGKARVFYDTKQDHVLCLAVGADGTVYAGTDKTGRVYRIDARGKGFVMYQAPQAEVRTLTLTPEALYVGTAGTKRKGGSSASRGGAGFSTAALRRPTGTRASTEAKVASKKGEKGEKTKHSEGEPAPAPSAPSSGENSVYRIALDGPVREVFREKALVMSLLRQGGKLFAGTGTEGQLFEVNESTRERSEIARLDHGQVLSLLRRQDGSIVVGTGDPGKLYLLKDQYAAKGTIASEVLDAGLISKWGSLRWRAATPARTSVSVSVRSGNVAEPDETWSDWSAEETDGETATITAPTARFLQYRVTLATEDAKATPALKALTLRYATTNQAPEVTKVVVPDLNAVNLDSPKKLKFKWSATDANEDELTYSLYVRKDGWDSWVLLEEDLDKTDHEWDATTTPSGTYRLKVVASDSKDNAEGEALTGERISAPFVVCHEAPTVVVKTAGLEGGRMVIVGNARSPLVRLTAASFAVNGKKWTNVFPTDGLFDSKSETFRFKTEALKPGAYVVVLKVSDAAGNTGTADVVFTVPMVAAVNAGPQEEALVAAVVQEVLGKVRSRLASFWNAQIAAWAVQTPVQMIATWENTVSWAPDPTRGGTSMPGLSGRLYLFGQEVGFPTAGDGKISVLLSEETNGAVVQKEVWNIDAATLKTWLRRDKIGWGYTMFLPWTTYRPEITKVRLKVFYTPAQGTPLHHEAAFTLTPNPGR